MLQDLVSDIGWKVGAMKGYFHCEEKTFKKVVKQVYFIAVLYHFTAQFHLKIQILDFFVKTKKQKKTPSNGLQMP